jgi:hypothetical protein
MQGQPARTLKMTQISPLLTQPKANQLIFNLDDGQLIASHARAEFI